MDPRFENLFTVMARATRREALGGTTGRPDQLPSPWESWTTISLARQRQRQVWACEVLETQLRQAGGSGVVPGFSEWEYLFHGVGCRLTHRVTGESIETETGEGFDFFFWTCPLRPDRQLDPVSRRMVELHPSVQSLRVTLAELREAGVVQSEQADVFRFNLSRAVTRHQRTVDAFCKLFDDDASWPRLRQVIGDPVGSEDSGAAREGRLATVRRHLDGTTLRSEALYALADLRAPELPARLRGVLAEPPFTEVTSTALAIIDDDGVPDWCDDVYRLYQRLRPDGAVPQPHLWLTSVDFLLRHGYRSEELLAALPRAGASERGSAALLGLEYSPVDPAPLFRRALLTEDSTRDDRSVAAAVLAVLDSPWSRVILLAVLRELSSAGMTAEVRAALRECRHPAAHGAADAWERDHPPPPLEVKSPTAGLLRLQMEAVHERVMAVRGRSSPWS
jgi:hypothetical protein